MADIEVTPMSPKGEREVLINGISIPDVTDVSMFIKGGGGTDEVTITIHADSFRSKEMKG